MTEKEIQHKLSQMDHRLFLDKRADGLGRVYYCVCFNHGQGEPFETLKWVYPDGTPRPYLNDDLIAQVQNQEGSLADAARHAAEHNKALVEKRREQAAQDIEDLVREYQGSKGRLIFHTTGARNNTTT